LVRPAFNSAFASESASPRWRYQTQAWTKITLSSSSRRGRASGSLEDHGYGGTKDETSILRPESPRERIRLRQLHSRSKIIDRNK
jgi:hypothetical protein